MPDTPPSFSDQAKSLLADFQHAADSNAPVSPVMLGQLQALIESAIGAHADCAALNKQLAEAEQKAARIVADMRADVNLFDSKPQGGTI
jgi:hypothetical protein